MSRDGDNITLHPLSYHEYGPSIITYSPPFRLPTRLQSAFGLA